MEIMKIGILTFHRPSNFGANLQAFSSVQYFKSLGHEVKIIDYVRSGDIGYKNNVDKKQFEVHEYFVEKCLPLTEQVLDEEGLCKIVKDEHFDVVVIGADAVWRAPKDNNIYYAQWLFDNEDISDVAVASISAAHMGDGYLDLPVEKRIAIKNCLLRFKYISVRDIWTREVLNRDIFSKDFFVQNVNPDPVHLLSRFVNDVAWESRGQKGNGYYLMSLPKDWKHGGKITSKKNNWFNKFKKIVNEAGYQLVELPIPEGKSGMKFDYTVDYPIDPLQWFLWIKNAKAFCGLRFHAIVSSISNGTPFYSIDSYGDRGRVSQLLDFMGLHSLARKRDSKSKIYNLLNGSSFDKHRTGAYIELESPKTIFTLLENTKKSDIINFRDKNISEFESNMKELIDCIKK